MTLSAGINTFLGVTVDETWSLVSRNRDQGFLWRPRDVYILRPVPVRVHSHHIQEYRLHFTTISHRG